MKVALVMFIIFVGLFLTVSPAAWKMAEKSFVNMKKDTVEIVYKGEVLGNATPDCIISYTLDFSEIRTICGDKETTWKNGQLFKEVIVSNKKQGEKDDF